MEAINHQTSFAKEGPKPGRACKQAEGMSRSTISGIENNTVAEIGIRVEAILNLLGQTLTSAPLLKTFNARRFEGGGNSMANDALDVSCTRQIRRLASWREQTRQRTQQPSGTAQRRVTSRRYL